MTLADDVKAAATRLRRAYAKNGIPWDKTLVGLPIGVMLDTAEYWERRASDDVDSLVLRLKPSMTRNPNVVRIAVGAKNYQGDYRHE